MTIPSSTSVKPLTTPLSPVANKPESVTVQDCEETPVEKKSDSEMHEDNTDADSEMHFVVLVCVCVGGWVNVGVCFDGTLSSLLMWRHK